MNKKYNNTLVTEGSSWQDFWQEIIESNESKKHLTGFKSLDNMLIGVERGSIITIGGRPGMGKSTLLMTILENASKAGQKCLYFALNSHEKEFKKRFFLQYAEFDETKIEKDKILPNDKEHLAKTFDIFKNFKFRLNCHWVVNVDDIEENIKEFRPDYVFIDYFQLIDIDINNMRTGKEISLGLKNALNQIKDIAEKYNCYVFLASQLSREVESRVDKRPLLSDLRESKAIADISDVVIFIYRESYYHISEEEAMYPPNIVEIILAKNKFGPESYTFLEFNREIPKFTKRKNK